MLVYQDDDERFNLGAGRTRDGAFIVMESASHITTECWFLAADKPEGSFTLDRPAPGRSRILHRPPRRPSVHPHQRQGPQLPPRHRACRHSRPRPLDRAASPTATTSLLEDIDIFANFFFACDREDGLPRLRLWKFAGPGPAAQQTAEIAFPEPAYSAHPHINRIFDTATFRYSYQSLVTPSSVYEYDLATGASTLLKQVEVPGGFDRTLYASERIHATAPDGTQVPVSLVYRKDARQPGKNPLYVYGYGSYGYSLPLGFNSNRLSLLDRGIVMAYAHIRGGGDLGEPWHDAGKMLVKRNTFTDFIACRRAPHRSRLRRPHPRRHRRRLRRRPAHGRSHQSPPRSLPRRTLPRPLRRRDEHHARRLAPAHRSRV